MFLELSRDISLNGRIDYLKRLPLVLVIPARHLLDRFRPSVDGYFAGSGDLMLDTFRLFFMLSDEEG